MAKTVLSMQVAQVQSLVGKLTSHMPNGAWSKKKKDHLVFYLRW